MLNVKMRIYEYICTHYFRFYLFYNKENSIIFYVFPFFFIPLQRENLYGAVYKHQLFCKLLAFAVVTVNL